MVGGGPLIVEYLDARLPDEEPAVEEPFPLSAVHNSLHQAGSNN
jgi:hypothetical protein